MCVKVSYTSCHVMTRCPRQGAASPAWRRSFTTPDQSQHGCLCSCVRANKSACRSSVGCGFMSDGPPVSLWDQDNPISFFKCDLRHCYIYIFMGDKTKYLFSFQGPAVHEVTLCVITTSPSFSNQIYFTKRRRVSLLSHFLV